MPKTWIRFGNFFKDKKVSYQYLDEAASFIKEITIKQNDKTSLYLGLMPSPFKINELTTRYQQFFPTEGGQPEYYTAYQTHFIEINSLAKLLQLQELLKSYNDNTHFPSILFKELSLLFNSCVNNDYNYLHMIADETTLKKQYDHTNPALKHSTALVDLLEKPGDFTELDFKQFKKHLKNGENINQRSKRTGASVCFYAVTSRDQRVLKWVLFYKGNPNEFSGSPLDRPNGQFFYTALEVAKMEAPRTEYMKGNLEILNLHFSHLPDSFMPKWEVKSFDLNPSHKEIRTHFNLEKLDEKSKPENKPSTLKLISKLKLKSDLNQKENQQINALFKNYFEPMATTSNSDFDKMLEQETSGSHVIVQLFHDESGLIGFNYFDITRFKKHLFQNWMFTLVDDQYRSIGFTLILGMTLVVSLQMTLPQEKMDLYFSSVAPISYRTFQPLLNFPMYQPKHHIYTDYLKASDIKYVQNDDVMCYAQDPLKVKTKASSKQPDCFEEFVYENILGYKNAEEIRTCSRGAQIFVPVGDELVEKTVEKANKIKLPALLYARMLAEHLHNYVKPFVKSDLKSKSTFFSKNSNAIFWENHPIQLRAKL